MIGEFRCQLCGNVQDSRRAHEHHLSTCVYDPVFKFTVRTVLDDGAGKIITAHQYKALPSRPIGLSTLLSMFETWEGVAKFFGLRPTGSSTTPYMCRITKVAQSEKVVQPSIYETISVPLVGKLKREYTAGGKVYQVIELGARDGKRTE